MTLYSMGNHIWKGDSERKNWTKKVTIAGLKEAKKWIDERREDAPNQNHILFILHTLDRVIETYSKKYKRKRRRYKR